jgi:hypothetical protein
MSSLLDPGPGLGTPRTGLPDLPPSPLVTPLMAAARAVLGGLVPVAAVVVLAWVLGAGGQETWVQAVRLSLGLWLLAQHSGMAVSGGHVGLVPLGLLAVPLLSCRFAGRWLARTMDPRAERIAAGATRAEPAALSGRQLLAFCAEYCLLACVASFLAGMPGMRPVSGQALLGSLVVGALGGGLGAAEYRFGGVRGAFRAGLDRVPASARSWLAPALVALAVQLAAGALALVASIATHGSEMSAFYRALDTGRVGGSLLTVGQALLVPNLVIWAGAVLVGPGFAIGSGTSVTVFSAHLGPLPAIPLLAALPAPGVQPVLARGLLGVPVLAGVLAGVLLLRSGPASGAAGRLIVLLGRVAGAGAVCALTGGLLAWLSGGPVGPGRMERVGPPPLLTGLWFGAEVALAAALTVLLAAGLGWLRPRLAGISRRRTSSDPEAS